MSTPIRIENMQHDRYIINSDMFKGFKHCIDFRIDCREEYETRVVSKQKVLDIGGRNNTSKSRARIQSLSTNCAQVVISTDIVPEYGPDLVDDISDTKIPPESFDGIYCDAVLEHVTEYWYAIENIYNILKPGGEAFFYVPFYYHFHDLMDFHRFTYTEVARMLNRFADIKVFVPGRESGFGYVFWSLITFNMIDGFPKFHAVLSCLINGLLKFGLWLMYKRKPHDCTFEEYSFYWIYLNINHGFAAWVRKGDLLAV